MGALAFGRYTLLDKLADGGMAELFLARASGPQGFQKTCVIKRVLPHLAAMDGFVEMFLDEARLAAQLAHPGLVQIFDLGEQDGSYFLAMEYLAGEDVAAVQRRAHQLKQPMPPAIATRIIAAAAEALHYAHEKGVVHRDISPSNLIVTYQGAVKVLDFGIASATEKLQARTQVGEIKGKAPYVAPEHVRGEPVDRRADVWALGVCLHELLAGTRLFRRDSPTDTLRAVCEQPIPSLRELRKDVPEELDEIVARCLERDVARRFPTAEALRAALDRYLADHTYLPQTVTLAQYLRTLFGDARADERLNLASLEAANEPATEDLKPPSASQDVPTVTVSDPLAATGRKRPGAGRYGVALVTATLVVLAGAAALRALRPKNGPALAGGVAARTAPTPAPTTEPTAETTTPPTPAPTAPTTGPTAPAPPLHATTAPEPSFVPTTGAPQRHWTPRHPPAAPAAPGRLSVSTNAPVTVWVDGTRLGSAPLSDWKLPPGPHQLRVENAALGLSRTVALDVHSGEQTMQRMEFKKGRLQVSAEPWADVWLDGTMIGQTPLAGRELYEGAHVLKLVGPKREKTLRVEVVAGQTLTVKEDLSK